MTEIIEINRQPIYVTIDRIRVRGKEGVEQLENNFSGFYSYGPPDGAFLGEQIKNDKGDVIVFNSRDEARLYIEDFLKRIVYPPNFYHPLEYTKENLTEILHKELYFDLGKMNSDEISETIFGVMIQCTLASNPPHLPATVRIIANGQERQLNFFEIKRIRK